MATHRRLATPPPPVEAALLRAARVLAAQYGHRLGVARPTNKLYNLTCAYCRQTYPVWYEATTVRPLVMAAQFLVPCPARQEAPP